MEVKDPWNVDSLEEFLYYCCPECKDQRIQRKEDFIKHALDEHPKSNIIVTKIIQVKTENFIDAGIECEAEYFVKNENNEQPTDLDPGKYLSSGIYVEKFENECDSEYFVKSEHIEAVLEGIKFQCPECGKEYKNRQTLNTHIKYVHEKVREFSCPFCSYCASQKSDLKKHVRRVHKVDLGKGKSVVTNPSTLIKSEYNEHLDWNNSETKHDIKIESFFENEDQSNNQYKDSIVPKVHNDFECNSCHKLFKLEDNLKRHVLKIHERHKSFKCDSCDKAYFEARELKNHIHRFHEGHKDYSCNSCGKSFTTGHAMRNHIKIIHEGQKDYKCETCGKLFTKANHLKTHIHTIHEGHKDYKCEFCENSFSRLGHLKDHIKRIHDNQKDKKCDICSKLFSTTEFNRHIKNIHREKSFS